jgi:hypothetical protein
VRARGRRFAADPPASIGWILFGRATATTAEALYEEDPRLGGVAGDDLATLRQYRGWSAVGRSRRLENCSHQPAASPSPSKATTCLDIPDADACRKNPTPPEGYEIARVDVVVRLRRKI